MDKQEMNWHKNIQNDPYAEPEEEATQEGCRTAFIMMVIFAVLLCFLALTGCKTIQPINTSKDSVRVEVKYDSVYVFKHDSIFRDRWRSGDTIYITTEKYQIRYKDKLVQIHDTRSTTESKEIPVKYVPNYYKNTSAGFWVLLVVLLVLIGWRIYKLYVKIQTGGLFR